MNTWKGMCIKPWQTVVVHGFSLQQIDTIQDVLTVEKVLRYWGTVRDQYCNSAKKLFRHLAQETVVSLGFAFIATKLLKFCLYRIIYIHELKQPDYATRIHFCSWLQQNLHDRIVNPLPLFITNETLSEYPC
jgi:hypothetical protein